MFETGWLGFENGPGDHNGNNNNNHDDKNNNINNNNNDKTHTEQFFNGYCPTYDQNQSGLHRLYFTTNIHLLFYLSSLCDKNASFLQISLDGLPCSMQKYDPNMLKMYNRNC